MSLYSPESAPPRRSLLLQDSLLIGIMAVLAACGLVYEYLLSSFAGRILGAVESAIFAMIGLMIVSMGLGAFAARLFRGPFTAFAWLEAIIALLGVSCILVISALIAFTELLPIIVARTFGMPPDLVPSGGMLAAMQAAAHYSSYLFGFLIGFLVGMEIPLIARVRERVYGEHLEHNAGTIYGADYLGAGAGAAAWVLWMLTLPPEQAAVITAVVNVAAGIVFLVVYWQRIDGRIALAVMHLVLLVMAFVIFTFGRDWTRQMTDILYRDQVIFSHDTRFQHLTVTERYIQGEPVYGFYLNGRLQFSSSDEHIYHGMLVYPPMLLTPPGARVLVIGGGDGLAVRDTLDFEPAAVTLIDLDADLVQFFTEGDNSDYAAALLALNEYALGDDRVEVVTADAFIEVNRLLAEEQRFDAIIVDLPDPSHPDLDRLYSDHFYARLYQLLTTDGVMSVQATSPYHAREAFLTVAETLKLAGFPHVEPYRQNVPSFGEWGWVLASKQLAPPRERLAAAELDHPWLTSALLQAAFEFPRDFFLDPPPPNRLGEQRVYDLHREAWQRDLGIYVEKRR